MILHFEGDGMRKVAEVLRERKYPTEYVKTRRQLLNAGTSESSLRILTTAIRNHGLGAVYTGAGAFCISNSLKSGVRFLTFDTVRDRLPKNPSTGKPTAISTMLAGVAAGMAESLTVVTPGENIKTKMIQERGGSHDTSSGKVIRDIMRSDGPMGFYRGVTPVMMKQGANALIRFTSYSTILDMIRPYVQWAGIEGSAPAIAGAAAGIVTVYCTMPFDVLKTRMQSRSGAAGSQGLAQSLATVVREEGIAGLWRGTTPRLARLSVSD
jgi:solute carrier family 25 (mitochondrial citrate transporter), member 1